MRYTLDFTQNFMFWEEQDHGETYLSHIYLKRECLGVPQPPSFSILRRVKGSWRSLDLTGLYKKAFGPLSQFPINLLGDSIKKCYGRNMSVIGLISKLQPYGSLRGLGSDKLNSIHGSKTAMSGRSECD